MQISFNCHKKACPETQNDIRVFNRWLAGRKITKTNIIKYLSWALKNRAVATIGRYKSSIKSKVIRDRGIKITARDLLDWELFFRSIRIPKGETRIVETKIISKNERSRLSRTCGIKTNLIIQALYESGARVSEILNLKFSDCKSLKGVTYCSVLGKGNRKRTVFLKSDTFERIRTAYDGATFLFETPKGTPVSRLTAHTLIRRAGNRIDRKITPHMLRHSRATDLLFSGETLPTVSTYLGHSSPEITARFYLHGMPTPSIILSD